MSRPILLLCLTRSPYPSLDGTRLRIARDVINAVSLDFEVRVFLASAEAVTHEERKLLDERFSCCEVVTMSRMQRAVCLLRWITGGKPLQVEMPYSKEAGTVFDRMAADADVIYAHTIRMGRFVERLGAEKRKRLFVDFNDAISLNYKSARSKARWPWRAIYRLEEGRVTTYEPKLLRSAGGGSVVCSRDQSHINRQACVDQSVLQVIPCGVADDVLNVVRQPDPATIVFVGNLRYPPNADAVAFLASIWPHLQQEIPGIRMLIIGGGTVADLPQGMECLGFVDELSSLLRSATCMVAPLRFGAGTPSKVIEALGYGLPVLTTSLAAEGIDGAIENEHLKIVLSHEKEVWIAAICELIKDLNMQQALSVAGRRLVTERYLSSSVRSRYRAELLSLAKSKEENSRER